VAPRNTTEVAITHRDLSFVVN